MTALLVIIYLSFISLGLPDSLLGGAWPAMQTDLGAPIALAGYISMVVQCGTVVSSLMSTRLIHRFGTGWVTAVSVGMIAAALVGFSFAPGTWFLFLMAIPLGLGAGSVDAALNNFVALHYRAKHMNWLHCFWGLGASMGPVILSVFLMQRSGWRTGYFVIAAMQAALAICLFATMRLWCRPALSGTQTESDTLITNRQALHIPNVKLALISFALYCATETSAGLWSSSYLTGVKGMSASAAALAVSCFYGAITVGRLLSGILSARLGSPTLIRIGQIICVSGAVLLLLPLPAGAAVTGIILIGLGAAPVYPGMIHETPVRFGAKASQAVIGLQMACAYIGSMAAPPFLGTLASAAGLWIFPVCLLLFAAGMLLLSELLNRRLRRRPSAAPPEKR